MLDQVVQLIHAAERSADDVADLCRRDERIEQAVAELSAAVSAVVAACPNGIPAELHARWLALREKVAAATTAAQTRSGEMAAELAQTARRDRLRRAYARPTG